MKRPIAAKLYARAEESRKPSFGRRLGRGEKVYTPIIVGVASALVAAIAVRTIIELARRASSPLPRAGTDEPTFPKPTNQPPNHPGD